MDDQIKEVTNIMGLNDDILKSYRLPQEMKDLSYDENKDKENFKKLIEVKSFSESNLESTIKSNFTENAMFQDFEYLKSITDADDNHIKNLVANTDTFDRYADIKPYVYNHIQLSNKSYVNASRINGFLPCQENMFIATQGPLENTQEHFWRMVLEKNVKLIIMLCRLKDNGRVKCHNYWPSKEEVKTFNDIQITYDSENQIMDGLTETNLTVSKGEVKIKLTHLQYLEWPDMGVPEIKEGDDIFDILISNVDKFYNIWDINLQNNGFSPIVVHCSAGVGRTGTFLANYNSYSCLKYQKMFFNKRNEQISSILISPWNIVRKIKEQRLSSTEVGVQYKFLCDRTIKMIRKTFKA